jgi:hypothetical protein
LEPFGAGRKPQDGIYGKDEKTSLIVKHFCTEVVISI